MVHSWVLPVDDSFGMEELQSYYYLSWIESEMCKTTIKHGFTEIKNQCYIVHIVENNIHSISSCALT